MNQHLEHILSFISQSKELDDDAKKNIVKAVHDANAELEQKKRELEIEAGLERVRIQAMAMNNSNDLTEAAGTMFTELNKLGINHIRSGFVLLTKDSRKAKLYPATSFDHENTLSFTGEFEFIGHPVFEKQYESWQKKENYFPVLEGELLKSYYKILSEGLSVPYEKFPTNKKQFGSFLPFTEGFLFVWSSEPSTGKEIDILNRFKTILDLTIRRYLDLRKVEAQAREAKIEAALERVRAKAMGMHSSKDLAETLSVVYRELKLLSATPRRCGVALIDKETRRAELTTMNTTEQGNSIEVVGQIKMSGHPILDHIYENWLVQKEYHAVLKGDQIKEYYHVLKPQINYPDYLFDDVQYGYYFMFNEGDVYAWIDKELTEDELQIYRRFTAVISLTYKRYNELQKAETQARESQIEAALERVRSKALAMQKGEDLAGAVAVVFDELEKLNLGMIRCGIGIPSRERRTADVWTTGISEPGKKVQVFGDESLDIHPLLQGAYDAWIKQEDFSYDLEGEDLVKYYQAIGRTNFHLPEAHSIIERAQIQPMKQFYFVAPFESGTLFAFRETEFPDEAKKIIKRFADVFNLTYTRFLDLQKAEAQAKEAQLERKRSEDLLLNILPLEIANELKQFGKSYARKHEEVTVLFADIQGFSAIAENLSADELVTQLDECFRAFDKIVEKHGLEKIKTVGDAYVCACGLPRPVVNHAVKTVAAALDMIEFIKGFGMTKTIQNLPAFEFRIGIHTGPVVTGVVGLKKFTYDIWGDAVNMAARMEQHGETGKVNISGSTYQLIKDKFTCIHRGKIQAKNKGEVDMYFVNHSASEG